MLLKVVAVASLAALAGCPSSESSACKVPAGPLAAELVVVDDADTIIIAHDGDTVPLHYAPQGGHILLVGARVHVDENCQYQATGSLRDPATNRVIGVEQRSMIVASTGDGWSQPDNQLSSLPNIAVCPNYATGSSVSGAMYELEVALRVGDQMVADVKVMVTPTCAADDTYCQSDCGAHQL